MLNDIFIIGNSHTYALNGHEDIHRIILKFDLYNDNISKNIENKFYLHLIYQVGMTAYSVTEGKLEEIYKEHMAPEMAGHHLCMFLGDSDIRYYLPKHKNLDFVVENYVKKSIEFAEKHKMKLTFITPVPICKDEDWSRDSWDRSMSNLNKEEAIKIHKNFIEKLKFECSKNNINVFDLSENVLISEMLDKSETIDNRHLRKNVSERLLNELFSKLQA